VSWAKLMRFVLSIVVVTLCILALMILLPHDKFLRYLALNDGQAPTAHWIYERINRDPTPIDIAFVGTSRTAFSIHSARMQKQLEELDSPAHVVNLHIVKMGRNMQFVVAKELLTHRKVSLLVLEMDDIEVRSPHPDFIYLADGSDVIGAPLFINFRYWSDLARLPGRQFGLFADTQLQKRGWATSTFLPPPYEGSNFDHSEFILTQDGVRHDRDTHYTRAQIEALSKSENNKVTPRILPESLDWLEYRMPRYYIEKILSLAEASGTRVVFLYLPKYGAPKSCETCGPWYGAHVTINPWAEMQSPGLWEDEAHMNWDGAKVVTDFVATEIVSRHLLDSTKSTGSRE